MGLLANRARTSILGNYFLCFTISHNISEKFLICDYIVIIFPVGHDIVQYEAGDAECCNSP
jgi:hypothetical protein